MCGNRGGGGADAILCFSSPAPPPALFIRMCVSTRGVQISMFLSLILICSLPSILTTNSAAAVTATSSDGWSVITKWWHQVCNVKKSSDTVTCLVHTVGFIKNETLVFVNSSAQDASILKISVPIIKRRSWGFQNTPNLQSVQIIMRQVMAI